MLLFALHFPYYSLYLEYDEYEFSAVVMSLRTNSYPAVGLV